VHLTRFGFNALVLTWLIPAILMDIVGNTISVGTTSDLYYYKAMFDALLGTYAVWQLLRGGQTMSRQEAARKKNDPRDSVVSFDNLGAIEYIYCAVLVLLAATSWWFHHDINKNSEGLISIATLVWSWLDIAVVIVAAIQFWHLKSGAIVSVSHKFVEH